MSFINVDKFVAGSIDMHLHPGITKGPARVDVIEAAQQAQQAGMKALVYKSHSYTAAVATLVDRMIPDIKIFGSICLNYEVGGINIHAVENAVMLGAKVVWMPTFSSANSIDMMRAQGLPLKGEGFSILDKSGKLVPEMELILSLIQKNNMVLATGHISPREIFVLVEEAQRIGIKKIVITHPTDKEFMEKVLTIEEMQQLAKTGVFMEFTIIGILPNEFCHHPADLVKIIKSIGAEHCIVSTDLGQPQNPLPVEGMRLFISTLHHHGTTPEEIELMVKVNPAGLLDIS
ncbi:MAG: hypothetical protein A2158_08480 [Chloroflexi bacterium RBG_13_46_14]|nr:MAG: hypothetical protein A2158_08480 [Chloroflexi bacterium RBG_13_46_14]